VIGVLAVAFVGESPAPGPRNHIAAFFRAVVATGLTVHVIIFELAPSLLEFLAPVVFDAGPRVAPGKIVVVETVVLIHRHPVSAPVALGNFPVQLLAQFEEFGGMSDVDVFGAAHRYGLDALVPHDDADAAGSAGVTVIDGGRVDPVFPGQSDGGHLDAIVLEFLLDQVSGLRATLSLEVGGITDLHLVIVDVYVNQIRGFAAEDDFIVAGVFDFRADKSPHQGMGHQIGLG
jgi:hypothetical protein